MFDDWLFHSCIVYRLQDINAYDFSTSDEGEVDEVWGIVEASVNCCFEWRNMPFARRADGIVDVGRYVVYVRSDVDVKNSDRIYRALGETGPEYYTVKSVRYVRDHTGTLHHKEIDLENIDWEIPITSTVFVPSDTGPNISIRQMWFSYTDTTKLVTDMVLGDWIQSISVNVVVPFNDAAATITVQDSDETLLPSTAIDLSIANNYHKETTSKQYSANDDINLTITKGTSTQGTGIVFAEVLMSP